MKKNKTSQVKALLEKCAPKVEELKYGEGENEFTVSVFPVLPFTKRTEMVREIADGVFMDDKASISTYVPEFLCLMQKFTTLKYFTDIELPKKINDLWLVLNYTSIYEDVSAVLGDNLFNIFNDANTLIDAKRDALVNKTDINSIVTKISDAVKSFENKVSPESIEAIVESLKGLSGSSSPQDIINAIMGATSRIQPDTK